MQGEMSGETREKLEIYRKLLQEKSESLALVSRGERNKLGEQIADSLAVDRCWISMGLSGEGKRIVDIGSGGGLPGIPLAIVRPEWDFLLVESNGKKSEFLEEVKDALNLGNVRIANDRAEIVGRDGEYREEFNFALGKGVAAAGILAELALPFLKVGGGTFFHKGPDVGGELREWSERINEIGGQVETMWEYKQEKKGKMYIVILRKVGETPERFPRSSQAIRRDQKRWISRNVSRET